MYGQNLAKLVHRLVKNPKERQDFLKGRNVSGETCNSLEYLSIKKAFSQPERVNDSVASIVPTGYWL
ncbi:hypothetical protein [Candidatus Contubernalis alkaliaceticus]|uniref:hypothetical protein n=1 Tax=Candidatus Contubernalis alkaliaceticus TaxID=338645 RepID=UPI001F4C0954|nr:hypothetical protein [Candidatus Contubernalis alkalaceticus]UNC92819.1 hypothetical protein HUE98_12360 [Candidatus Contubernalis alkalaceticus]